MGPRFRNLCAGMLVALAALPASAHAIAGDVFVVDANALGPPGDGAVFRIGASGGTATAIAGPSAQFEQPTGLALDSDGTLLLTDYHAAINALYRVASTGSISTILSGNPLIQPSDVARDPSGSYVVSKFGSSDAIFRVSRRGEWSTIYAGAPLMAPTSVVVARSGAIYIADEITSDIYRIGRRSFTPVLFGDSTLIGEPEDLALSPDERTLYVANGGAGTILKVDTATGAVSSFAQIPSGSAHGLELLPDQSLLVSDASNGGRIMSVPASGSPVTPFSTDAAFEAPHDIVVEPAKCSGKTATVVGTNGADKIRGSASADVISTLGGKDMVKSFGGKDTICGGGASDRLFGGGASDKLLGQEGKDTLNGGEGRRDVCKGGRSADVGAACEKGKV